MVITRSMKNNIEKCPKHNCNVYFIHSPKSSEYNVLKEKYKNLSNEVTKLNNIIEENGEEYINLRMDYNSSIEENSALIYQLNTLQAKYNNKMNNFTLLVKDYNKLVKKYNNINT